MVRYELCNDIRYIYKTKELKYEDRIEIAVHKSLHEKCLFVNILEHLSEDHLMKLKIFYSNGDVIEGWCHTSLFPVSIYNEQELYDGRFNQ